MKKLLVIGVGLILIWSMAQVGYSDEEWQERKTLHFSVFYRKVPLDFIKNIEDISERCYDEIIRDLGFRHSVKGIYDNRIKIYIFNNNKDFVAQVKDSDNVHGVAYFRQRTIRTFPSAHGFFDSTLPHELGHILFRDFIGNDNIIPLWLDEGVAMYQEKARRWGAHETVKNAVHQKRFMPLVELSHKRLRDFESQEEVRLFYSHSASVVSFMIKELGEYRFLTLCNLLRDGIDFDVAIKKAYRQFDDIQALQKAWISYVEGE